MRKTLVFLFVLVVVASGAFAGERGSWNFITNETGGNTSLMMGIGVLDDTTFFAVGLNQFSETGMTTAWKSIDSGLTLEVIDGITLEDPCDIVAFMNNIWVSTAFFDINTGIAGGAGVPEECLEQGMPGCLACVLQIAGWIRRTTTGGGVDAWDFVTLPEGTTSIDLVQAVNESFGVATGSPNCVLVTNDAGATWEHVGTPMAGDEVTVNSFDFVDENVGFMTTGTDTSAEMKFEENPLGLTLHRAMMRNSGLYRLSHRSEKDSSKAIVLEGIHKTVDGGQTWETLVAQNNWVIYAMDMASEQYGVVVEESAYSNKAFNTIHYTEDGGVTWNKATIPEQMHVGTTGEYTVESVWMVDNSLGYAGVVVHIFRQIPEKGLFLVTTDGGKTWEIDQTFSPQGFGFTAIGHSHKVLAYAGGPSMSRAKYTGHANTAPTAEAAGGGTFVIGETATLDGSGSSDPEGDRLSFKWELVDGPNVDWDSPFGETNNFTLSVVGTVSFQLTVNDGEFNDTDPDVVTFDFGPPTTDDDDDTADDDADDDAGDDDDDDDDSGGCCG